MKKIFLLFAIVFITLVLCSCDEITNKDCTKGSKNIVYENRVIPGYNSIITECGGNYYISQEENDTLIIQTDDNIVPLIHTSLYKEILKIESESICPTILNFRAYMKIISRLSLGGSGNIVAADTLHTDNLDIDIDGSGTVDLFGTCKYYTISLNGSGNIELLNFISDSANVTINGSGNIRVNATKYLYAYINGSGNIYYKGNPTVKNIKINGSGQIINVP